MNASPQSPVDYRRDGFIELLQIKDADMIQCLDSILSHEKRCKYYSPSLYFHISFQRPDAMFIESYNNPFTEDILEQSCFEYHGHFFYSRHGNISCMPMFEDTGQKIRVHYFSTSDGFSVGFQEPGSIWKLNFQDSILKFSLVNDYYCHNSNLGLLSWFGTNNPPPSTLEETLSSMVDSDGNHIEFHLYDISVNTDFLFDQKILFPHESSETNFMQAYRKIYINGRPAREEWVIFPEGHPETGSVPVGISIIYNENGVQSKVCNLHLKASWYSMRHSIHDNNHQRPAPADQEHHTRLRDGRENSGLERIL